MNYGKINTRLFQFYQLISSFFCADFSLRNESKSSQSLFTILLICTNTMQLNVSLKMIIIIKIKLVEFFRHNDTVSATTDKKKTIIQENNPNV